MVVSYWTNRIEYLTYKPTTENTGVNVYWSPEERVVNVVGRKDGFLEGVIAFTPEFIQAGVPGAMVQLTMTNTGSVIGRHMRGVEKALYKFHADIKKHGAPMVDSAKPTMANLEFTYAEPPKEVWGQIIGVFLVMDEVDLTSWENVRENLLLARVRWDSEANRWIQEGIPSASAADCQLICWCPIWVQDLDV